jgi:hypothetical protein
MSAIRAEDYPLRTYRLIDSHEVVDTGEAADIHRVESEIRPQIGKYLALIRRQPGNFPNGFLLTLYGPIAARRLKLYGHTEILPDGPQLLRNLWVQRDPLRHPLANPQMLRLTWQVDHVGSLALL